MTELAYAQAGNAATGPHPALQFLPLILVFVVFYFLLIRPQQKKARERQDMIGNLKRNDEVLTTGGLYGKVMELNEKVVTLEIAPKVNVRIDRQHIEGLVSGGKVSKGSSVEEREGKEK
jgi:preprotein translocase subunit YajC